MWQELLRDSRLFHLLLKCDRDLAAKTRTRPCAYCGGPLHQGNYPRKPRGGPPQELRNEYTLRFSFCCGQRGCRKRATPPSMRFLGPRVYLGAVVVLVSAMRGGITEKRAAEMSRLVGVSIRTLYRWRTWWRETFPTTAFFRSSRGHFPKPVAIERLPAALLDLFSGKSRRDRLLQLLRFLCPITTRSRLAGA